MAAVLWLFRQCSVPVPSHSVQLRFSMSGHTAPKPECNVSWPLPPWRGNQHLKVMNTLIFSTLKLSDSLSLIFRQIMPLTCCCPIRQGAFFLDSSLVRHSITCYVGNIAVLTWLFGLVFCHPTGSSKDPEFLLNFFSKINSFCQSLSSCFPVGLFY